MMDVVMDTNMTGPIMPESTFSMIDISGDASSSMMKLLAAAGMRWHRSPKTTPRMTERSMGSLMRDFRLSVRGALTEMTLYPSAYL